MKKISFRVDASMTMGIGHVMRCLTLADSLKGRGAQCQFICRQHPGNLIPLIIERGYAVHPLPLQSEPRWELLPTPDPADRPPHASWLGSHWETDARQTRAAIGTKKTPWLIVDHYSIDTQWENELRSSCDHTMIIDDLADRSHDCDILLDQTYKRTETDYRHLTPAACHLFTGAQYALLRPEFAKLRAYSLGRRKNPQLKRLLISMGGIDKDNVTTQLLHTLTECKLAADCHVQVVMGKNAPWLDEVKSSIKKLSWSSEVLVDVRDMARLMAESDLAIGAAGSTTWERCCLGLPTLMMVLADNQRIIAEALSQSSAVRLIETPDELRQAVSLSATELRQMSHAALEITDGKGTKRITQRLMGY